MQLLLVMTSLLQLNVPSTSVGTQVFVSLVVGLLVAFAVQLLLTNLGLTLGVTALKFLPLKKSKETTEFDLSEKQSNAIAHAPASQIAKISFFAGFGILLTLNSVLFIACFLAIQFSKASEPIAGATLGIVIWSAYFIILVWISSSTVSSVLNLILGSVSKGVRQLLDLVATVINREEDQSQVLTEAAAADLIQQEIQTALNQFDLQKPIEDYLETIPSSNLDLVKVQQSFEELLTQKLDLSALAKSQVLPQIDRETINNLISKNSNLSPSEQELVVERLESVWQKVTASYSKTDINTELLNFLESTTPEDLDLDKFSDRLQELSDSDSGILDSLPQFDWGKIKNILLNRVELSDLDLEEIWQKLPSFLNANFINNNQELSKFKTNTIKTDVENYLSNSSAWYLKTERAKQEFKDVIYDPQADPQQVRSQLEQIKQEDLSQFLQQRNDLDSEEVEQITESLETVRQEVFDSLVETDSISEIALKERLINYLQTVDKETLLNPNLPEEIEKVLIGSGVGMVVISQFIEGWHQIDWQNLLQTRNDLEPKELEETSEKLSQTKAHFQKKVQQWQKKLTSTTDQLQQKLESYLRYTNIELITPEAIEDKLNQLWQESNDSIPELPKLPSIKKEKLKQILARRKGVDKSKVESITEQIETRWQKLTSSSEKVFNNIQAESIELTQNIINYVQKIIEEKVNPNQIEQDLQNLIKPDLINKILQLDWDNITEQLQQNQKYSQTQIKSALKQIKQTIRKLIKIPRRWAIRTQKQIKNELEDFLSYGNKNDLTPQQIERNLKKIFDSSLGNEVIANITQQTPENITKILSKRSDLSEIEIQHISDRVNSLVEKNKAQSNQILEQIDKYLNSLNLFQLDYKKLRENLVNLDFKTLNSSLIQTLKDIPLEQISDRVGKLSYETLINLIEANNLVTEAIPEPILNQIQGVRDYVTQQIDTTKQTALDKVETLKQQTIKQTEETTNAIAVATYWLCAITFTSMISSVVAGVLATKVAF